MVCVDHPHPKTLKMENVLHMYTESLYKGVIYTTETFNFRKMAHIYMKNYNSIIHFSYID